MPGFTVEDSVHVGLVSEQQHHGGRVWQRKAAWFMSAGKRRKTMPGKKGPGPDRNDVQGHTSMAHPDIPRRALLFS